MSANAIASAKPETEPDPNITAFRDGYITVTPLQFDLIEHKEMAKWAQREWKVAAG